MAKSRRRSEANPFWRFSLRLYRRPGVAPACLALQDRLGVDVNLLLFCLWAGADGRKLTAKTIALAVDLSRLWSDNVVRPLRHARRFLKPLGLAKLRAEVARVELATEHMEQDLLYRLAPPRPRKAPSGDAAGIAVGNVMAYAKAARLRLGATDRGHLAAILASAFPDADIKV